MEERDWLMLRTLYQHKNITKTARSLYVSQPALTNRLRQIEKEFGVTIVYRGTKGVEFTPQGEYLVKCAEEMLRKIRTIKENLANMDSVPRGTLRLGVSSFIARYKLPGLLKLFKDKYPHVEFQIYTGWSRDVLEKLNSQEVHIGFVKGEYPWADQKLHFLKEKVYLVSKEEIRPDELPALARIEYQTDSQLKSLIDHWWANHYQAPPFIGMEVDNVDTCKEMVANGLGYAILPGSVLTHTTGLHCTELRDLQGEPVYRSTWMLFRGESLKLHAVKAFVDFISETVKTEG
ncbi:LysR family transcriptional regulator [Brevibacillus sp. B_LB10_24]|uniref:LysR family transcriptional regulator n=1 Tax=Brevibacillus sp. B_LB10_24 TaxID=3380645 RepID=UPI0038BC82AB